MNNLRNNKDKSNILKKSSFVELKTETKFELENTRRMYKERSFSEIENIDCFKMFNPVDQDTYKYIVKMWTKV